MQDLSRIDKATQTLNDAWQAASADLYSAQQNQGGSTQPGPDGAANEGSGKSKEDVTDVEFEEVK